MPRYVWLRVPRLSLLRQRVLTPKLGPYDVGCGNPRYYSSMLSFYEPCAKWHNPRGIRTPSLDRIVPAPEGTPNRSRAIFPDQGFPRDRSNGRRGIRTPSQSTRSSIRLVSFRLGPRWSSFAGSDWSFLPASVVLLYVWL